MKFLVRCRHRAVKNRFSYALYDYRPRSKLVETLDFDIAVFEVPRYLSLAGAIAYIEHSSTLPEPEV